MSNLQQINLTDYDLGALRTGLRTVVEHAEQNRYPTWRVREIRALIEKMNFLGIAEDVIVIVQEVRIPKNG